MVYCSVSNLCVMQRVLPIIALLLATPVAAQSARVDSIYETALDAYESGDWLVAETLLATVIDRDRDHDGAHHLLARVYAEDGPQHDARRARRHADLAVAAAPNNPRILETRLRQYQRDLSEERAFSMTDGRRAALARKILSLDSTSALAHDERALAYFLEFDWRRNLANQRGGWNPEATRGMSGAANRALGRMEGHLEDALAAEPDRASSYRLALRAAASARDDDRLLDIAQRMKAARPHDPDAALFFGLALYRADLFAAAEEQFRESLSTMPAAQRRRFENVLFLVHKDTVVEGDTAAFAARFWRSRDPRLLTPQNERWLEHYARLALTDLLFTDTFRQRRGWDSVRGEVAVRYGLPTAEASQLSLRDGRFTRWFYDDFSLLFEDTFISGDPDFQSSSTGEDEATRARSLMTRVPERFDYRPANRVDFPFAATTFRGDGDQTDVYVHLGLPESAGAAWLRAGAFLVDDDYAIAATDRRAFSQPPTSEEQTETLHLHADAGTYELAVEFERGQVAVGFERDELTVPAYPKGVFAMSDLLLAQSVEEVEAAPAGLVRRGLQMTPVPSHTFGAREPIYVYVEGYDLVTTNGRSRYALDLTLVPVATTRGLVGFAQRLFRGRERGVGVGFEGEASGADIGEYVVLDASNQSPGPYLLTLRLQDLGSGETLERTAEVFIE